MVLKVKNKTFIIAIIGATLLAILYMFNLSTGESKCVKDSDLPADKHIEGFNVNSSINQTYAEYDKLRRSNQGQGDEETKSYYNRIGYDTSDPYAKKEAPVDEKGMSEEARVAIARARSAAKIAQAEAAAKIAEAEAKSAKASSVSSTPDSQVGSYNFFTKNNIPLFYYGPYGSTATVVGQNNQYMIVITTKGGETIKYRAKTGDSSSQSFFDNLVKDSQTGSTNSSSTVPQILPKELENVKFYDENGNYARIFVSKNGQYVISVTQTDGINLIYTSTNVYTYDSNKARSFVIGKSTTGETSISEVNDQNQSLINNINNNTINAKNNMFKQNPNGIPGNMIPKGKEDLYILKSEIVPPVCPRCPVMCADKKKKCPPCPSCARCPPGSGSSSSKGCPDYGNQVADPSDPNGTNQSGGSGSTNDYSQYRHNKKFLPVPVVSGFSTFGM